MKGYVLKDIQGQYKAEEENRVCTELRYAKAFPSEAKAIKFGDSLHWRPIKVKIKYIIQSRDTESGHIEYLSQNPEIEPTKEIKDAWTTNSIDSANAYLELFKSTYGIPADVGVKMIAIRQKQ